MSLIALSDLLQQEYDKWSTTSRKSTAMDAIMEWVVRMPYLIDMERQQDWRGIYAMLQHSTILRWLVLEKCFVGRGYVAKRMRAKQYWKTFLDQCISWVLQERVAKTLVQNKRDQDYCRITSVQRSLSDNPQKIILVLRD